MSELKKGYTEAEMKGWLFKWTNYIKGYQKRWFVLNNGLLSYYRNPSEISHTCRGTINLHGATIHTEDSCTFVISNGGAQTFHIKAASEVERQRWVTALELAKENIVPSAETDHKESHRDIKTEVASVIKILNSKLEDMKGCHNLVTKRGNALNRSLVELEVLESVTDMSTKAKAINEKATLFRITVNAMMNSSAEYVDIVQAQGKKWQRMLQHERERRIQLEKMVEQLAREQSALESASKPPRDSTGGVSSEDESAEFFDAQSESSEYRDARCNSLPHEKVFDKLVSEEFAAEENSDSDIDESGESPAILTAAIKSSASINGKMSQCNSECNGLNDNNDLNDKSDKLPVLPEHAKIVLEEAKKKTWKKGAVRRKSIQHKPNHHLHIWSILKNCIGKDLSRIPMPVNFSEPLSMLQRLTEDFEYAELLDTAAKCDNPFEKLAYIAAFSVSAYSTTVNRTGKPFNPLLGETYECDRSEDLGWKAVNEQVSHHPPIAAQYCEGKQWIITQEFSLSSKFRGRYLQVIPNGKIRLKFKDTGSYYTWSKVTTIAHNIIVGKLWLDQDGDVEIINHETGYKCHLTYIPYSYFSRNQQRKVKGEVTNEEGEIKYVISGTWDTKIEMAPALSVDEYGIVQAGDYTTIWQRTLPSEESEKYYNFTELACQLNEMEEDIAPTDSRLRPDQRLMELDLWDEANIEKLRLEEKQRHKRKERNAICAQNTDSGDAKNGYEPVWFKKDIDLATGDLHYVYQQEYWSCKEKQDWARCPDIF